MSWTITKTDDGISVARTDTPSIDPTAFGVEQVVVAGGVIDVDVRDRTLPFAIRLHSAPIAALWLPFVTGQAATDAVLDDASAAVITVASRRGHLADVARRFALGTWMRRWWVPADWEQRSPRTPQEWLLDAEIGTLAHSGSALFASHAVADLFLDGAAPALATELQVRVGRHGIQAPTASLVADSLVHDPVATAIAAAAAATLDRGLLSGPAERRLVAAESGYWDAREGATAETSTLAEILASRTLVREPWDITMDGRPKTAPLDPLEVHPRSVRAGHLSWRRDGTMLHVRIDSPYAGSVPIAPGELFARVEFGSETYAIALEATPEGFAGRREIDTLDHSVNDIRVSAYSDRISAGGRRGRAETDVDATRAVLQAFADSRAASAVAATTTAADVSDPAGPFAVELAYLED